MAQVRRTLSCKVFGHRRSPTSDIRDYYAVTTLDLELHAVTALIREADGTFSHVGSTFMYRQRLDSKHWVCFPAETVPDVVTQAHNNMSSRETLNALLGRALRKRKLTPYLARVKQVRGLVVRAEAEQVRLEQTVDYKVALSRRANTQRERKALVPFGVNSPLFTIDVLLGVMNNPATVTTVKQDIWGRAPQSLRNLLRQCDCKKFCHVSEMEDGMCATCANSRVYLADTGRRVTPNTAYKLELKDGTELWVTRHTFEIFEGYTGRFDYHTYPKPRKRKTSLPMVTNLEIGLELELISPNAATMRDLAELALRHEYGFLSRDGSLRDEDGGTDNCVELVTNYGNPLIHDELLQHLPLSDFRVNHTCGLHVNLGRDLLDYKTQAKLYVLLNAYSNQEWLAKFCGRTNARYAQFDDRNYGEIEGYMRQYLTFGEKYRALNTRKEAVLEFRLPAAATQLQTILARSYMLVLAAEYARRHTPQDMSVAMFTQWLTKASTAADFGPLTEPVLMHLEELGMLNDIGVLSRVSSQPTPSVVA